MTFFPGLANQDMVRSYLQSRAASAGSLGALLGDFLFFRADDYLNSNTNILMAGYRSGLYTATTTSRSYVVPFAGILRGLYVKAGNPGVGTGSAIFTVRASTGEGQATADTAITCSVPLTANPNEGADDVHEFECTTPGAVVQVNVRRSPTGTFTTAPTSVRAMLLFIPT